MNKRNNGTRIGTVLLVSLLLVGGSVAPAQAVTPTVSSNVSVQTIKSGLIFAGKGRGPSIKPERWPWYMCIIQPEHVRAIHC